MSVLLELLDVVDSNVAGLVQDAMVLQQCMINAESFGNILKQSFCTGDDQQVFEARLIRLVGQTTVDKVDSKVNIIREGEQSGINENSIGGEDIGL
ncbi:hypothetical protein FRC01_002104 [Tulasnella sp. 417]|nr:hypothetical protein FRC01_002104 [Tulasnella sp. 417]